jgi:hypothetical protein
MARRRSDSGRGRLLALGSVAAAVLLVALALVPNIAAVRGLEWPPEMDHYRDAGAAQSILDGNRGDDPITAGERWWYPPLVPTLWAVLGAITGQPLPWVVVQFGVWIAALGAMGFYALSSLALGRGRALICLAAYLFLGAPSIPPWAQAGLSPWPWPAVVVQGLAYAAFAAWLVAVRSGRIALFMMTGLLLGLTFLGHAAPALILALAASVHAAWGVLDRTPTFAERTRAIAMVALMGGCALLLVSPFLVPLIVRYGFRTLNDVPGRLVGLEGTAAARALLGIRPVLAAVGLWIVVRRPPSFISIHVRRALLALTLSTAVLMAYGFGVQTLDRWGWVLPLPVPAFHFHLYQTALQSVFFGCAVAYIAERLSRLTSEWKYSLSMSGVAVALTASAVVLVAAPTMHRPELAHWRRQAQTLASRSDYRELYVWARTQTSPGDVFLSNDDLAMYPLSAAGRRVVGTIASMTSPFVDHSRRSADRDVLCATLSTGDVETWRRLAQAYHVRWIVLSADPPCMRRPSVRGLRLVASFHGLEVFDAATVRAPSAVSASR